MITPLIAMPQGAEWLVILVIVVLVFGAAKLPDLARSSGQALRIFKTETKSLRDSDQPEDPHNPDTLDAVEVVEDSREIEATEKRRDDTTA